MKSSSRSDRSDHGLSSHKPRRHNSDISLSTIAEETHSHASSDSVSSYEDRDQDPSSVRSSLNGTSVFLEPHITVETSTVPANGSSSGSSRCSSPSLGSQVTKVTATAKFKLELHTPVENSRPSSRRSRRSSASSSRNGDCSTNSSLDNPLRSSGDQSLASSLSSDGGYSEKWLMQSDTSKWLLCQDPSSILYFTLKIIVKGSGVLCRIIMSMNLKICAAIRKAIKSAKISRINVNRMCRSLCYKGKSYTKLIFNWC